MIALEVHGTRKSNGGGQNHGHERKRNTIKAVSGPSCVKATRPTYSSGM